MKSVGVTPSHTWRAVTARPWTLATPLALALCLAKTAAWGRTPLCARTPCPHLPRATHVRRSSLGDCSDKHGCESLTCMACCSPAPLAPGPLIPSSVGSSHLPVPVNRRETTLKSCCRTSATIDAIVHGKGMDSRRPTRHQCPLGQAAPCHHPSYRAVGQPWGWFGG